jgi:hypothetical protein
MTTWKWPVSWSKMKAALTCPLQLQYAIDKKPTTNEWPNYWRELGITTQKTWELYFNNRFNTDPKGRRPEVPLKILDRILVGKDHLQKQIRYPEEKSPDTFRNEARAHIERGFAEFEEMGAIQREVSSEEKFRPVFRGVRLYLQTDFRWTTPRGVTIVDGKGNKRKDADPAQLLMTALGLQAMGMTVTEMGFLYWQHGYEEVDVSAPALKEFADGPFAGALDTFRHLRGGIAELPAKPADRSCFLCPYREACPASLHRKKAPTSPADLTEVGFETAAV